MFSWNNEYSLNIPFLEKNKEILRIQILSIQHFPLLFIFDICEANNKWQEYTV